MGYFAKRIIGGGLREVPGGYSDPEAEYYIETMKEYEADVAKIRKAERAQLQAEKDAEKAVEQAYADAKKQMRKYKAELDEAAERKIKIAMIAKEEAEIREKEAVKRSELIDVELQRQKYLNSNLKRIARERANQDRNITPKKEHDGYLVMNSRQWVENYEYTYTEEEYDALDNQIKKKHPYPYKERRKADVWKSVIQTPYDASIPLDQVKSQIKDELRDVMKSIGCQSRLKTEYNGVFYDFGTNEEGYPKNGMYKWKYIANYRSGFWEIEVFTTKSLKVPEYRRPYMNINRVNNKNKKKSDKNGKHGKSKADFDIDLNFNCDSSIPRPWLP